jgi:hypothetical protein
MYHKCELANVDKTVQDSKKNNHFSGLIQVERNGTFALILMYNGTLLYNVVQFCTAGQIMTEWPFSRFG